MTFENGENAFAEARRLKIEKYRGLAETLRGRYKTVAVEAIVVGALGAWDRANDRVVARLCSRSYAKLLRKLIVADTLRASRDIYIQHLTGIRQQPTSRSDRHAAALAGLITDSRVNANVVENVSSNNENRHSSRSPQATPPTSPGSPSSHLQAQCPAVEQRSNSIQDDRIDPKSPRSRTNSS